MFIAALNKSLRAAADTEGVASFARFEWDQTL